LEATLWVLAEDVDLATESSKLQVRGTADEHIVPAQRSRHAPDSVAALKHRAQAAGDMVVTEIRGETAFHSYLRKELFPGLFDMRKEHEELMRRRFILARSVMEVAIAECGVAALEEKLIEKMYEEDRKNISRNSLDAPHPSRGVPLVQEMQK
jgi:hypothetical protein